MYLFNKSPIIRKVIFQYIINNTQCIIIESKYCVVISDFETGEILDVVVERKYEYLASSLLKLKISIANGLVKNKEDLNYSNSKAEGNNGLIQRIIDCAFGHFNFVRFRKRVLLIKTYSK